MARPFVLSGMTSAVLVPPAFGLADVNLHTWTGGGSVPYWSSFVPNSELHGKGNFFDSRLRNGTQFPRTVSTMSATNRRLITSKLASLRFYQLAIPALEPPAGSWRLGIRYLSCPAALEAAGNDPHPAQDLPRKRSAVQAKAPRSNGLTKRHGRVGSF